MRCKPTARGFGCGSGTASVAVRDSVTAHTILSVATSERTRGTVSKSIGEGKRGTLLQCRRCSTHARTCKTSGRPCGETSHRADTGCEGRMGQGFSLPQVPEPRQRRIWRSHPRGRTCPAIMTQFESTKYSARPPQSSIPICALCAGMVACTHSTDS